MLANNYNVNTRQEYPDTASDDQQQPQQYNQHKFFWAKPGRDEENSDEIERQGDDHLLAGNHAFRHEHGYVSNLEQWQKRRYQQEHPQLGQQRRYHERNENTCHVDVQQQQQARHTKSLSSLRSTTIHPTIANMVSPSSPWVPPRSPPRSFYRSFSPVQSTTSSSSTSPRSKNVYVSPERESGDLHYHRHRDQPQHRHHSLPLSPVPRGRDELMDVDKEEYAFEELSSDSMMDQCEPQRGWSSSSSLPTNSPSPVMSYTPYQFPLPPKRRSSSSSFFHRSQQDLPPPQQQPLRDHHAAPRSPGHQWYRHQQDHYQHFDHPQEGHHQNRLSHEYERHNKRCSRELSSLSTASKTPGSIFKKNSLKAYLPRKPRSHPFAVPNDTDVGLSQHSSASPTMVASSVPFVLSFSQRQGGCDSRVSGLRPQTPPLLPLPSPQQQQGSQDPLRIQHQHQHKEGERERERERVSDVEKQRDDPRRTIILPLSKNFEYMSEAQRMLYERHPPSPKCDRSSSSSSSSSPSSRSYASQSSSAPISPVHPTRHASYDNYNIAVSSAPQSHPDHSHEAAEYDQEAPMSHLGPSQHQPLWPHQETHPGPQLPRLSALTLPRQRYSESESLSSSSARSSVSFTTPSPSATIQTFAAAAAAATTVLQKSNLPGTEGMTVVKNDEGAIMVYNPRTENMTFRCELCPGESFGRIHDLKRHQTSKHQEMTWPCDFCHRPFVRRDALLRHYTVKAARADGLHPASHEVDKLLAARARAKMLY